VRWSLDLRWQDAALPEGNFGLKKAILMSKAADSHHSIDWASWANLDKKSGSADGLKAVDEAAGAAAGLWGEGEVEWGLRAVQRRVLGGGLRVRLFENPRGRHPISPPLPPIQGQSSPCLYLQRQRVTQFAPNLTASVPLEAFDT